MCRLEHAQLNRKVNVKEVDWEAQIRQNATDLGRAHDNVIRPVGHEKLTRCRTIGKVQFAVRPGDDLIPAQSSERLHSSRSDKTAMPRYKDLLHFIPFVLSASAPPPALQA